MRERETVRGGVFFVLLAACLKSGVYEAYPDQALVDQNSQIYRNYNYSLDYDTTTHVMKLFGDSYIEMQTGTQDFCNVCLPEDFSKYVVYF